MMKTAKIIHNPGAGESGRPTKEELISMVESAGFNCTYLSVKEEGWRDREFGHADFVIAAGGDGTVKKTVRLLLRNNLLHKRVPVGLLPVGTANNIATALGISGRRDEIIKSWNSDSIRDYDLCMLSGAGPDRFFIEGFGFGLFPFMVKKLKERKVGDDYPEDKNTMALKLLLEVLPDYPANSYKVIIDGKEYLGNFLMLEVLNISGIGPKLNLAPYADPGDGSFDVVLITEEQRADLSRYLKNKITGTEEVSIFTTIKAKTVEIYSDERLLHVDDVMVELDQPQKVEATVLKSPLAFFR